MKKKVLIISTLVILSIGGYFGFNKVMSLLKPANAIILYSSNKNNIEQSIEHNKKYIKNIVQVEAKYLSESNTLVLDTKSAQKLIDDNAINHVNKKGNSFTFRPVKSLSKTPVLWTSDLKKTEIKDKQGQIFTTSKTEYIVLGEASITKNTLVLDNKDFNKFKAPVEYVSVIEEKRDAADVLTKYKFDKVQIFKK